MICKRITYCLVFLIALFGCKNKNSVPEINEAEYENVVLGDDLIRIGMPERLDYLIDNLVLSDEMIGLLAEADKSLFDENLLNSPENVKYYSTSRMRAVNMGVYGAELNYLIHFSQSQFSMKYVVASKQIADQIGVAMAFDQDAVREYQSNVESNDSLITVIFGVYDNARRMLKNEEQFMLSSLVIVGSWVENMYITTKLFKRIQSTSLKSKIVTKILEQKDYLSQVVEAVELLDEGDNVFVTEMLQSLNEINKVYSGFGDRLLSEKDIHDLEIEIEKVRTQIIKVN